MWLYILSIYLLFAHLIQAFQNIKFIRPLNARLMSIKVVDGRMEFTYEELAERAIAAHKDKQYWIGIAGGPGSGWIFK